MVMGLLLIPWASAHAQSGAGEPFELVRALQSLQDQVARGNASAHASQRVLMARIAEQFSAMKPERWKEPRNARAAVLFVLSGGNGGVLRQLLDSHVPFELDEKLVKGLLAYGSGQKAQAAALLHAVDARSLDASIAGHVAYVQAELAAEKEPAKAFAYLDDARLLAPGTLIEEAAWRRQIGLAASDASTDRYRSLAIRYLHRFPNSIYAGGFRNQFAADLAANTDASKAQQLESLDATLRALSRPERRDVCLVMAKVALDGGKVALARFAATEAAQAAQPGSPEQARAHLLLAVALVVTEDLEKGVKTLAEIERASLGDDDASLVDAALTVAEQIRRPVAEEAPALQPPGIEENTTSRPRTADAGALAMTQAREAIARVDQMLTGASQ
jgi:chemotaxis protein MotC